MGYLSIKAARVYAAFLLVGMTAQQSALSFNLRDSESGIESLQAHKRKQETPVVKLLNAATSGSGVIIGVGNSTYTIATAYHVVSDSSLEEIFVELADGNRIKVKSVVRPFPEIDLAFLTIGKTSKLPVAILPFLDKELWEKVDNWPLVYVIGYSAETPDAPQSVLRSDSGKIQTVLSRGEDGYNLLYKANTVAGMSGGGIFGETLNLRPFIKDPFSSKREYFYGDLSKDMTILVGTGHDGWQDGVWEEKKKHSFQNAFHKKCMESPHWEPEFSGSVEENGLFSVGFAGSENWKQLSLSFKRSALCKFGANLSFKYKNCKANNDVSWFNSGNEKKKNPDSFLLLAIHGRSERSDQNSGNRTGSALGVYLGSPAIRAYLESKQKELGLMPAYTYASRTCMQKSS